MTSTTERAHKGVLADEDESVPVPARAKTHAFAAWWSDAVIGMVAAAAGYATACAATRAPAAVPVAAGGRDGALR